MIIELVILTIWCLIFIASSWYFMNKYDNALITIIKKQKRIRRLKFDKDQMDAENQMFKRNKTMK